MEELEFEEVKTEQGLAQCLAVRRAVFIDEMGVPEDIEADEYDVLNGRCAHFLIICGGVPVGAFRCLADGTVHLQRLCILPEYRGKGIGRAALARAERFAADMGAESVELHAKRNAAPFYSKCGYFSASAQFYEAGVPHVKMVKKLS